MNTWMQPPSTINPDPPMNPLNCFSPHENYDKPTKLLMNAATSEALFGSTLESDRLSTKAHFQIAETFST